MFDSFIFAVCGMAVGTSEVASTSTEAFYDKEDYYRGIQFQYEERCPDDGEIEGNKYIVRVTVL